MNTGLEEYLVKRTSTLKLLTPQNFGIRLETQVQGNLPPYTWITLDLLHTGLIAYLEDLIAQAKVEQAVLTPKEQS